MPNLFSAFTNDVFRPLATLLIPGRYRRQYLVPRSHLAFPRTE